MQIETYHNDASRKLLRQESRIADENSSIVFNFFCSKRIPVAKQCHRNVFIHKSTPLQARFLSKSFVPRSSTRPRFLTRESDQGWTNRSQAQLRFPVLFSPSILAAKKVTSQQAMHHGKTLKRPSKPYLTHHVHPGVCGYLRSGLSRRRKRVRHRVAVRQRPAIRIRSHRRRDAACALGPARCYGDGGGGGDDGRGRVSRTWRSHRNGGCFRRGGDLRVLGGTGAD